MNDQLERDIRNLFCNTGELSRDEVTGILLGLLDRIQHLEQLRPEQEPVACPNGNQCKHGAWCTESYCQEYCEFRTPPQRKPLTDEEIKELTMNGSDLMQDYAIKVARAIEAAHGIKGNT